MILPPTLGLEVRYDRHLDIRLPRLERERFSGGRNLSASARNYNTIRAWQRERRARFDAFYVFEQRMLIVPPWMRGAVEATMSPPARRTGDAIDALYRERNELGRLGLDHADRRNRFLYLLEFIHVAETLRVRQMSEHFWSRNAPPGDVDDLLKRAETAVKS